MELLKFVWFTISNIFMSEVVAYSYSKISNVKFTINTKNSFIIVMLSIIQTINNYYNIPILKLIIAILIAFLISKFLYKDNIKDTFVITLIITVISIIIEFLTIPIMAIKVNNIDILNNEVFLKLIYSFINSLILIFIIRNKKIQKSVKKIKSIVTSFMNFYNISVIFLCLINIIIYTCGTNIQNIQSIIVIIISILLLLICLRTIINEKYNNCILIDKNRILKDEHRAYSETIEKCRELKHNLKNELYSLKTTLPKEYQRNINTIITKYNVNYEWINTLNDIPEGLQGLIYLKINEAKKKRIDIKLNTKSNIKTQNKDYINLCNTIGILIDNAIEASEHAKSKTILINIFEGKNKIIIEILNKFNNRIDINELGKKNYSTKEFKSGLGLNFIKKINSSKIKVDSKIINSLYITTIQYQINKNC